MNDDFEKENMSDNVDRNEKYEYATTPVFSDNLKKNDFVSGTKEKPVSDSVVFADKKMKKFLTALVVVLLFLVVSLVSYIIYLSGKSNINIWGSSTVSNSPETSHVSGESEIKFAEKSTDERELTAESIYSMVSPCVVGVVVYDTHADIVSDPASEGSGIIISDKGYIVTNSHVVKNSKQTNIKIVLNNSEECSGKVVGYDSKTDLAVIKIDKSGLQAATFGNSDEVKAGASVLAIGNPLGLDFASSITRGIVSAVNRSASGSPKSLVKYIQTDAAINPGNSGGPLINMYGQIIGINSSKIVVAHCEGMGFAIPSNTVKSVVDDIIEKGYVSGRVRLGLMGKMVSNYQAQMYDVPIGIIVSEINKDSNLSASGVQVGDIITKINGVTVTSFDAFYGELYNHKANETITLTIFRPSRTRSSSGTFEANVVLLEDKGETQESASNSNQ